MLCLDSVRVESSFMGCHHTGDVITSVGVVDNRDPCGNVAIIFCCDSPFSVRKRNQQVLDCVRVQRSMVLYSTLTTVAVPHNDREERENTNIHFRRLFGVDSRTIRLAEKAKLGRESNYDSRE